MHQNLLDLINSPHFANRLVGEIQELYIRIRKLEKYLLKNSGNVANIAEENLMRDQMYAMNNYLVCLCKRATKRGIHVDDVITEVLTNKEYFND